MPTQDFLRKTFSYNRTTGTFKRRLPAGFNAHQVGKEAGWLSNQGYRMMKVHRRCYVVHRLIWIYVHGEISPTLVIDHINRKRADNRIINLRLVTTSVNCRNRTIHINNKSGYTGVFYSQQKKKWEAYAAVDGRRRSLGYFTNKRGAIAARAPYNFKRNPDHLRSGFAA